jgi:hypothetical protein
MSVAARSRPGLSEAQALFRVSSHGTQMRPFHLAGAGGKGYFLRLAAWRDAGLTRFTRGGLSWRPGR